MNYMQPVPDPSQMDPSQMPQQMEPGQPPPDEPVEEQDPNQECLEKTRLFLCAAATSGATSQDADAVVKYGQAIYSAAQAIKLLEPAQPSPDAALKAQTEVVKTGAQQAHDQHQQDQQRQHDMAKVQLEAVRQTANTGGQDGGN